MECCVVTCCHCAGRGWTCWWWTCCWWWPSDACQHDSWPATAPATTAALCSCATRGRFTHRGGGITTRQPYVVPTLDGVVPLSQRVRRSRWQPCHGPMPLLRRHSGGGPQVLHVMRRAQPSSRRTHRRPRCRCCYCCCCTGTRGRDVHGVLCACGGRREVLHALWRRGARLWQRRRRRWRCRKCWRRPTVGRRSGGASRWTRRHAVWLCTPRQAWLD